MCLGYFLINIYINFVFLNNYLFEYHDKFEVINFKH